MNYLMDIIPIELNYVICSCMNCEEIEEYCKFIPQICYNIEYVFEYVVRINYKELYPGIVKMLRKETNRYGNILNIWKCIYGYLYSLDYNFLLRNNQLNVTGDVYYQLNTRFRGYHIATNIIYGALLIINSEENYKYVDEIQYFVKEYSDICKTIYHIVYHPDIKLIFFKSGKLEKEYHYTYVKNLEGSNFIGGFNLIEIIMLMIILRKDKNFKLDGINNDTQFINQCKKELKNNDEVEQQCLIRKFLKYVVNRILDDQS